MDSTVAAVAAERVETDRVAGVRLDVRIVVPL
jgi:hypothetical protein